MARLDIAVDKPFSFTRFIQENGYIWVKNWHNMSNKPSVGDGLKAQNGIVARIIDVCTVGDPFITIANRKLRADELYKVFCGKKD